LPQYDASGRGELASSVPEALVQQAGFIFAGTVQQLGAATVAHLPAERTAVVRVDSPVQAPALLQAFVGRDITVELRSSDELSVGDDVVFLACGWVYGPSIALRELAHWPIGGDLIRIRRDVVEATERLADEALRRRLTNAVAVVAGRVAQIAEVPRDEREPERERDPQWIEAVIAVDLVLRGSRDETSVVVLSAGSRHVAWRNAPKLRVGQSGVWILHEEMIDELDQEALVLVDPLDSWPLEQLRRIQALLGEID
jgi:hypothetical protein